MKPCLVAIALACGSAAFAEVNEAQRKQIDEALGATGAYTAAEDTYRVTLPRRDVKFLIEGRAMHPFMGFTSWAAFTPSSHGLMAMGDLVLLEDEVSAAMSAALDNGLEVTALHNHFFFESPRVMFMHIGGAGDAGRLAAGVRKALDAAREVRKANPDGPAKSFGGAAVPDENRISAAAIDAILGVKGQSQDGMYKMTIGRRVTMHGGHASNQMGVNTWAAFAGTDERALVDGDFAVQADELQGALKALRRGGIHVVAIHNHMTHEQPQYVFLHYWGKGPAAGLAKVLRSALDSPRPQVAGGIVFVCEHGAAKSVMAASYFNELAAKKGLAVRAVARGTSPDAAFAPKVVAGLAAEGLPAPAGAPVALGEIERSAARQVVFLSLKAPAGGNPTKEREWMDVPAVSDDYGKAAASIRKHVADLVAILKK